MESQGHAYPDPLRDPRRETQGKGRTVETMETVPFRPQRTGEWTGRAGPRKVWSDSMRPAHRPQEEDHMRAPIKVLLVMVVAGVAARLAAIVVSDRLDEGSEVSDEFRRTVVLNGLDFTSRSGGLRSAAVKVMLGGASIDLRHAVLDPAGARMHLENTLGGLQVRVRDDWAVTVDETLIGGGVIEVDVSSPDTLPTDAPRLHLEVISRMGGTAIRRGSGNAAQGPATQDGT